MREIARALVFRNSKLLVIRRKNNGKIYTVFPGGGLEEGESSEEACIREVYEETSIQIKIRKKIFETSDKFGKTTYFLADYLSGEPKLSLDSDEYNLNKLGLNTFTPLFLSVECIDSEPFFDDSKKAIKLSGIINNK